jgi:hypothetical protein
MISLAVLPLLLQMMMAARLCSSVISSFGFPGVLLEWNSLGLETEVHVPLVPLLSIHLALLRWRALLLRLARLLWLALLLRLLRRATRSLLLLRRATPLLRLLLRTSRPILRLSLDLLLVASLLEEFGSRELGHLERAEWGVGLGLEERSTTQNAQLFKLDLLVYELHR